VGHRARRHLRRRRAELLVELNDINAAILAARVYLAADRVIAATELRADTLDLGELAFACDSIGALADWIDNTLQSASVAGRASRPTTTATPAPARTAELNRPDRRRVAEPRPSGPPLRARPQRSVRCSLQRRRRPSMHASVSMVLVTSAQNVATTTSAGSRS